MRSTRQSTSSPIRTREAHQPGEAAAHLTNTTEAPLSVAVSVASAPAGVQVTPDPAKISLAARGEGEGLGSQDVVKEDGKQDVRRMVLELGQSDGRVRAADRSRRDEWSFVA